MGIDLHRVSDSLELDCSFGHYLTPDTLLHWAYKCGAFAPPAFSSHEELYEKQEKLFDEVALELGFAPDTVGHDMENFDAFMEVYNPRCDALFRVPGDARPSISTFAGSTGYQVSPEETQEMIKRLPKKHQKYQHFIDFLKKCEDCGFTID